MDESVLVRMAAALRHRGPDDAGTHLDRSVGLAHARLSVIDLNSGHQPMTNEDGNVWVVFNGEIYNFAELRRRLLALGHRFRTNSDTETIVHLYEQDGDDCFQQLRGMFAIAIWDARVQRLTLARDRIGKKPLVYADRPGGLAFASEIKALLEIPGLSLNIDQEAVDEFLSVGYIPAPHTIYKEVRKLPPGHYAVYERSRLRLVDYRPASSSDPAGWENEEGYCATVRKTLTESTRLRLVSDVPLGAFLSGGIDSTIIVGLMQQLSERPVKTFSIRFSADEYDEGPQARETAQRLGTEHHEFFVEPDCMDVLPRLVWHFDEPFADSSAIPTYYLAQYTRQHVTVALSGDGGDELFCGYDRYRRLRDLGRTDFVPRSLRAATARLGASGLAPRGRVDSLWQRAQTYWELFGMTPAERYARIGCVGFRQNWRDSLYAADFAQGLGGASPTRFLREAFESVAGDAMTRAMLADQATYLPGDILCKVDIASMAHGLECRSPFLDQELVDAARRTPISMKLRGRQSKFVLRKAFADLLPASLLARPKRGFVVPLKRWFREDLRDFVHDALLSRVARERGYFQVPFIRQLLEEHVSGRRDHSMRLWMLLVFELWNRQFIDAPSVQAASV